MKAFDTKVNEHLRRSNLVFEVQEKAVVKAGELIDYIDNPKDLKDLIDGVDKASLTMGVNQRHSNSQVNIQNTNATQVNNNLTLDDFYK